MGRKDVYNKQYPPLSRREKDIGDWWNVVRQRLIRICLVSISLQALSS